MRFAIVGAAAVLCTTLVCSCGTPYPKVPLAAPLAYTEGEEALARGELIEAEKLFRDYLASDGSSYRARARYQLARTQYQMEDYAGAELSLDQLDDEFPGFGARQVAALRGDIAYALGDPVDAIVLWESAYKESHPEEKDSLRPRIAEAMRSLNPEQAKEVAAVVTEPEIYEMAIDRLAGSGVELAAADGGVAASEPVAVPAPVEVEQAGELGEVSVGEDLPIAEPIEAAPAPDSDTAIEPAPEGVVEPGIYIGPRIAGLLPLTGAGRIHGEQALVSLRESIDAATLIVRDTGSDPVVTAELVRQLAADRDVIAVLGPMLPADIDVARREASRLDLPLLPLPIGGAAAPPSRTAADPARALASHAVGHLGVSRIGILTPSATAGGAFAEAAKSLGATIAGTYLYDPQDVDINAALISMQSWIDGGGIDAVYIADVAPRAIQLAKAARAAAPQVVLLGDAGWNDAGALTADAPAIEGAVIAGTATPSTTAGVVATPQDTIPRAAAALQRAIALGQTDRSQTHTLLATVNQSEPQQTVQLMRIVNGHAVAIQ